MRTRSADGKRDPTYVVWFTMKQRCLNPKMNIYARYGGRGIRVCERWMTFENFLADMGTRPPGMQLDRHPDNNGNYEPGNCRWATPKQNSRNRRNSRYLTFDGQTLTLPEWAEITGLKLGALKSRLRSGWSAQEILGRPSTPKGGPRYRGQRVR